MKVDHDVRKVSSSYLRYYTNISSQYTWYTCYINEAPFCYIRPVDLPRLSWLDHTIRSNLHHRSGINLSLCDVYAIVHRESATAINHHHRRWNILYIQVYMSWIGPCWLLKIVPWYFLKGKTPHHMHKKILCPTQLLHLTTHQLA